MSVVHDLAEQTVSRSPSGDGTATTTWDRRPDGIPPLTQHERVLPTAPRAGHRQ